MIEDLKVILEQGKSTVIKGVKYLSAKDYIQPFVDRLKPLNAVFRCNIKAAEQLSITDNTPDIVYNRVHIQAILPKEYYYENECQKVLGMIYGLDTKKAIAKFYIGDLDENKNLIVFNTNALRTQEIEDSTALDYSCIKELLELTDTNATMLDQLKRVYLDKDKLEHNLGEWIDYTLTGSYVTDYGKIKLATSVPITSYKSLVKDKESDYYTDSDPSMFNVYKSLLRVVTDENDIINSFEKTILINRMLNL